MRFETRRLAVAVGVCLFGFAAGAVFAQTTATETSSFEVLSVDGNKVVVREASGAKEYTVPDDFRFDVAGKQLSVHDLKPGMKGKATITTKTTTQPVYVTEVRKGTVKQVGASSVLIHTDKGYQMYTQGDVSKRSIQILRDGKPVQLSELRAGDQLTATFVTEGPPKILTERQVQASLAAGDPAKATTPTATKTESTAEGMASSPAPAATMAATGGQEGGGTPEAKLPTTASPLPLLGLIGMASLALGTALRSRRRRG